MFKDKLKKIINDGENLNGNNKKKIENLAFIAIVLIITIVIINYVWNGNSKSNKTLINSFGKQLATVENEKTTLETNSSSYSLENRLEDILKSINGVGKVKVFINYYESGEMLAMYNENSKVSVTEETDTSGRAKENRNYRFTKRNNISRRKWR